MKKFIQNPQGIHQVKADLFLKQIGICKNTDSCQDCHWQDDCKEKPEGFLRHEGKFFINSVEVHYYYGFGFLSSQELWDLRQSDPRIAP